jgi:hypothetical protein
LFCDLDSVVKLPPQKAKKQPLQFPMTGEPGAEKILMFAGALPVMALESNGQRALVQLGFGCLRRPSRRRGRTCCRGSMAIW